MTNLAWEVGAKIRDKNEATVVGNDKDHMLMLIYAIDWLLPIDLYYTLKTDCET